MWLYYILWLTVLTKMLNYNFSELIKIIFYRD